MLKFTLFDINQGLCDCWKVSFKDYPEVSVSCTDLHDLPYHDVLVAPGNSFGLMDGGLDRVIRDLCGGKVFQQRVFTAMQENALACIPVGQVISVFPVDKRKCSRVLYAPTMLKPAVLDGTLWHGNVFLAFAGVLSDLDLTRIDDSDFTVAVPGLGAGTGGLSYEDVAFQMQAAYRVYKDRIQYTNWTDVSELLREVFHI